jgi:membrane-associated phospholipid phosphatase
LFRYLLPYLLLFSNLVFSQSDTLPKIRVKPFIVPVSLAVGGLITQGSISRSVQQEVLKQYPNFETKVDDYLPFAPLVAVAGLDAIGVKGRHKWSDKMALVLLAHVYAQSATHGLKILVAYPRPDGVGQDAFPSGHTSFAFTNAALLSKEYGQNSLWYSVIGYGVATSVGAYRMVQNRHWLADVLFGAGVGIVATELAYLTYPWLKKKVFKGKNVSLLPFYNRQAVGLCFVAIR